MTELQRPAELPLHDPAGPSTLGRLLACPGSLRASMGEPELSSVWAQEGERLHAALAEALRPEPGKLPETLSDEERQRCEACLEFVAEKIGGRCVLAQWVEQHVELVDEHEQVVNYGTADLIVLVEAELLVFDFKFGRKVHQHALVLQLANYAAAAATSLQELTGMKGPPVAAYAYFPLYDESYVWRAADFCSAVPQVTQKVKEVIAGAHAPDAELRPGPHCDYCNHLPNCAAVRERTALVAEHFQARLPADPKKVVALYDAAKLAEKQASAVISRVKELLDEDPRALPGLVYTEVNGIRSVEDPGRFWAALVAPGHVDAASFSDRCTQEVISITKAEELYVETHYKGRGNGGLTKDKLKARFRDITEAAVKQPKQKRLRRVSE